MRHICYLLLTLLTTAHMKAFSLTLTLRNIDTGRSSAAGLLPQTEAPWSPWQPRHSERQHWVRVIGAVALSHRAPALMAHKGRNHCHHLACGRITVLHILVCVCGKESIMWLCSTPGHQLQNIPELSVVWVCDGRCCIRLYVLNSHKCMLTYWWRSELTVMDQWIEMLAYCFYKLWSEAHTMIKALPSALVHIS